MSFSAVVSASLNLHSQAGMFGIDTYVGFERTLGLARNPVPIGSFRLSE